MVMVVGFHGLDLAVEPVLFALSAFELENGMQDTEFSQFSLCFRSDGISLAQLLIIDPYVG